MNTWGEEEEEGTQEAEYVGKRRSIGEEMSWVSLDICLLLRGLQLRASGVLGQALSTTQLNSQPQPEGVDLKVSWRWGLPWSIQRCIFLREQREGKPRLKSLVSQDTSHLADSSCRKNLSLAGVRGV